MENHKWLEDRGSSYSKMRPNVLKRQKKRSLSIVMKDSMDKL